MDYQEGPKGPPYEDGGVDDGQELTPKASRALFEATRDALEDFPKPHLIFNEVEKLHGADLADLIQLLSHDDRPKLLFMLGERLDPDVLSYLDEAVLDDILPFIEIPQLTRIINDLDSDDAMSIIESLDEETQKKLLNTIPAGDRVLYEQSLSWPEESAGRLMRREVVTVPNFWTVGQALDYIRTYKNQEEAHDFYTIIVVGGGHKPVGLVPVSRLLQSSRVVSIMHLSKKNIHAISVTSDEEDVALTFQKYGLVEAPVVDEEDRLVGVITVDDVVDVLDEVREEDMLNLGGVTEDDFYADVAQTVRKRGPWLFVNLLTAILASLIISMFSGAIEQIIALAVLMPIVASMGGNAATQTLTVAVRALATRELTRSNAMRIVLKEVLVGGSNGLIFAVIMGIVASIWFASPVLGMVIGGAMIINLFIAGFAGVMIPLGINRLGLDPAIASSVFVTTVTDVVGFLSFLGMATLILL